MTKSRDNIFEHDTSNIYPYNLDKTNLNIGRSYAPRRQPGERR